MRELIIGAAQMGAIQMRDDRTAVIQRMIALLDRASISGCELVVFPELALTTFFPRWYMEDRKEIDSWFETAMPNKATAPLFQRARDHRIALSFGYAELTSNGNHYNTSILTNKMGEIVGKYRKVHLPGHSKYDDARAFQHLEKRYFEPGDLGFQVWKNEGVYMGMCICNDRRWPEAYRVMGLKGVELIMLGYNTPKMNSQNNSESLETQIFHSDLSMQAGAYQNSSWVVGVAKAGNEDGHPLFGGSVIIGPDGLVRERAESEDDELIVHSCDMDSCAFGKKTIFDFARHRRTEHYGLITEQTGVIYPE